MKTRLLDPEKFREIRIDGFKCSCGCDVLIAHVAWENKAVCYDCHAGYELGADK